MRYSRATFGKVYHNRGDFAAALGLAEDDLLPGAPIISGSTGSNYLYVPLRDCGLVDRAALDVPRLVQSFGEDSPLSVFIFAPDLAVREDSACNVYSRMFAPHTSGVPADPGTGSASGALGAYLLRFGLVEPNDEVRVISEQGTKIGRQSLIHIRLRCSKGEIATIDVGGHVVHVADGVLSLG